MYDVLVLAGGVDLGWRRRPARFGLQLFERGDLDDRVVRSVEEGEEIEAVVDLREALAPGVEDALHLELAVGERVGLDEQLPGRRPGLTE